jgi:hypothetical protein
MARIATTTYGARVKRGLDLKNGDDLWFALGKTSAWPNDESPPSPLPGDTEVTEPFIVFKPIIKSMAREVSQVEYDALQESQRGVVVIDEVIRYLKLVSDENAQTEVARYVYLRGVSNPALGHPAATFRQIGIYSGLVPAAGYENAEWLATTNVDQYGLLEYLDNGTKTDQTEFGPVIAIAVALEFE